MRPPRSAVPPSAPDGDSRDPFYEYYARQSTSESTLRRFEGIRTVVRGVLRQLGREGRRLTVLDVGCGAGTQCMMWARDDHDVIGVDVNEGLVALARRRAAEEGLSIRYEVGSSEELPVEERSVDVCLVPELLEHVPRWERCLDEFARVTRPGAVLYLSTTNRLCPVQQEFTLPLYSWYPEFLKRRYERLAVTTRPELVTHAPYPAVNWFTFYGLRRELDRRGFTSFDRFQMMDTSNRSAAVRLAAGVLRAVPPLRWLGQVVTPYTALIGVKAD